jgi:hypothetical protein
MKQDPIEEVLNLVCQRRVTASSQHYRDELLQNFLAHLFFSVHSAIVSLISRSSPDASPGKSLHELSTTHTASHTPCPIEQGSGQGHHGWGFSDFITLVEL